MPPSTSDQPERFLVHHQGQVLGPFSVDFIEAMVMSGAYPSAVIVERPATSERLPFSNLASAAGPRTPPQKNPQSHMAKSATVVAWIVGVFGVCVVLWIVNLVTTSKKPDSSRSSASADWSNPSPTPSGSPTSAGTNDSSSPSKNALVPTRNLTTPPARTPYAPPSYLPADDSMVYRDESGRSYRVSNADYNRLLGMRSALIPKSAMIDRSKKERQALSSQLEIDRINLDQTSQYAVDTFNRKINRLNAMNGPLQALVDDFNRDVDAFNAELERVGTPIN